MVRVEPRIKQKLLMQFKKRWKLYNETIINVYSDVT